MQRYPPGEIHRDQSDLPKEVNPLHGTTNTLQYQIVPAQNTTDNENLNMAGHLVEQDSVTHPYDPPEHHKYVFPLVSLSNSPTQKHAHALGSSKHTNECVCIYTPHTYCTYVRLYILYAHSIAKAHKFCTFLPNTDHITFSSNAWSSPLFFSASGAM